RLRGELLEHHALRPCGTEHRSTRIGELALRRLRRAAAVGLAELHHRRLDAVGVVGRALAARLAAGSLAARGVAVVAAALLDLVLAAMTLARGRGTGFAAVVAPVTRSARTVC